MGHGQKGGGQGRGRRGKGKGGAAVDTGMKGRVNGNERPSHAVVIVVLWLPGRGLPWQAGSRGVKRGGLGVKFAMITRHLPPS